MPTYELTCKTCGHEFDVFVMRLLRQDDMVCPDCGSTEVKRGVGGGVILSGSAGPSSGSCEQSRFS